MTAQSFARKMCEISRVADKVSAAMPEILAAVEREICAAAEQDRAATIAAEQRIADSVDTLGRAYDAMEGCR